MSKLQPPTTRTDDPSKKSTPEPDKHYIVGARVKNGSWWYLHELREGRKWHIWLPDKTKGYHFNEIEHAIQEGKNALKERGKEYYITEIKP